jgi:ankyrin repeat protein
MASNEEVVLKISTSFKRLCGGGIKTRTIPGCNCYSSLLKFNQSSEEKKNEWLSHLESLAEKSLSYPNGTLYGDDNDNNNDNDNPNTNIKRNNPSVDDVLNIGKPHDAEIKLALSFFHRYRHKCIKYCSTQSLSTDNGENVIPPLEITSDTGLTRSIQNPMEFAKLMVNDLEDWIWHERQKNDRNSHQLYSIRIDQSGIICMVTPKRVEYLHSIGRLSCSRCTKWVKGEKGLWWHCQKEHNLDHSIATAIASSSTGVNEFSMVVYRSQSEDNVARTRTFDATSTNACVPIEKKTDPYFQIIKDGDLQQLVFFLEKNEGYNVITYNDRNGASALHWAAGCGHIDIVKFLIEQHKCLPDQGQKGKRSFRNRTPLHWACRNGHLGIVKYFVEECNVDIDTITIDGTTAFCWSCWQGHEDVMR